MTMKKLTLAMAVAFGSGMLSGSGPIRAQGPAQPRAAAMAATPAFDAHDISGYWNLSYDMRRVPAANLAVGVTKVMLAAAAKRDAHAIRYCNLPGMPVVMDLGRPLDIQQGLTQIILTPEANATPRYLYFRSAHISPDVFDPTTNGDSIARWEGDALIVDTIGFHGSRGITSIPGGGYRTANTHLVERYRLMDGGNTLSVTFTWIDPKIYRTPHTYEYRYHRMPSTYEPQPPAGCNPYDDARTKFLEGPVTAANAAMTGR